MAALTLYGSAVANGTLTTACTMAPTTGGTETSKQTTYAATTNTFGEIWSQGKTTATTFTAIQAPTGNGWVYQPGAGTFANANWSAIVTLSLATFAAGRDVTIRFSKDASGTFTTIGSINVSLTASAKTTYTFTATSMPATTFGASDLLYVDLWYHDGSNNVGGDNPTVYESNSATQGVANDVQVTTSNFTPSGGVTHFLISDGYGGVFS